VNSLANCRCDPGWQVERAELFLTLRGELGISDIRARALRIDALAARNMPHEMLFSRGIGCQVEGGVHHEP